MARNYLISEAAELLDVRPVDVLRLCTKAHIYPTKYAYALSDGYLQDLTQAQFDILSSTQHAALDRLRRANARAALRCTQLTLEL